MLLTRTGNGLAQQAVGLLRRSDLTSHVWTPGANGASVGGLASNNYLLSDGSTGYSTVDGVDGLMLDGMGSLGSELVTNGTFPTDITDWSVLNGATLTWDAGRLKITSNGAYGGAAQNVTTVIGKRYVITVDISSGVSTNVQTNIGFAIPGGIRSGTGFTAMFEATVTSTPISLVVEGAASVAYFDNISVKEFTGIHATQSTTANKPIVRRGAYNLLPQSKTYATAPWARTAATATNNAATAADGTFTACTLVESTATTVDHYAFNSSLSTPGVVTVAIEVKANGRDYIQVAGVDVATAFRPIFNLTNGAEVSSGGATTSSVNLGNGWFLLCWSKAVTNLTQVAIIIQNAATYASYTGDGVSGVLLGKSILTQGTFTAQQLIYNGGLPVTTTVAASNPSAGKYWLSFDGSNDSLLVGNIGFTNAATIIVAGRVNALSDQAFLGEDTNGVLFYVGSTGILNLAKSGGSLLVQTSAGAIVAGVPFVLTVRLSGGTAVIRKDGVQVATAATAQTFSATTGMRIGTEFAGTLYPLNGALGELIALPQGLTDAECLTLERYVASSFPSAPVF